MARNNKDISIPENLQRSSPYENDYSSALIENDLLVTYYDAVGIANALADYAYQAVEEEDDPEVLELFKKAEMKAAELAAIFDALHELAW